MTTKSRTKNPSNSHILKQIMLALLVALVTLATLPVLAHAETDWSSLLEQAAPAVVLIEAKLDEESFSYGSGAIISPDGYVLTAQHVIEGALSINVYVPTAGESQASFAKHEASLMNSSADADIAILKISARSLPCLRLGDSSTLRLDEEIRLLGYPQQTAGIGLIIGRGVYLGSRSESADVELIQIDVAPFDHGHSGGPVISVDGKIVGVAVKTWTGAETHKLAVSVNTAKRFIPSSVGGSGAPSSEPQTAGPAPSTWAIYGYSNKHLYVIPGDPSVGYPIPMPRPLPVEWAGSVIAGPDGQFYCTDVANGEIVRFDPRTRKSTLLFESSTLHPADLVFDLDGNLLFSTYGRKGQNSGDSMGIWRIPGAAAGATAEKLIDGADIRQCGVVKSNCRFGAPTLCVLTTGPFRGDLLVSGKGDIAIARAVGPDYTTMEAFIRETGSTYPSGEEPIPAALSDFHQILATGVVLATDFINGRILEFDPEGRFAGVFTDLFRANRITSDYAGNIYASGSVWGGRDLQHIAGFSPDGTTLFELPIGDVVGVIILEE